MKSAGILILISALLIQGCAKSPGSAAARQRELAGVLKPLLKSTWVGSGEDAQLVPGRYDPANQQPLRIFIAKYPDTEEAYEAELWLLATAPIQSQTFEQRRNADAIAERLETIGWKTSCPGAQKMAELARAFALYRDLPGDHSAFYRQVDDILDHIQDFKSENSGPFRRYLEASDLSPSTIEPALRFLVMREKCNEHKLDEALSLATGLKQKFPNWESRSVNGQIEMIQLYESGRAPWI